MSNDELGPVNLSKFFYDVNDSSINHCTSICTFISSKHAITADELNRKVERLVQDIGHRRGHNQRGTDLQQDLSECASLMYDKAFGIFQQNIETFYR